eukprot:CAMPEP_0114419764 /NCGR_PEP_ID=MMETSP0103-20121206/4203_1 /TAXON_ID=37642 ORGANISM="Paraphysomonas imperforata, Strain PA2" /NCGR_SAMPLE_ID=MMETSP0103 /ASSEMBLY_ACC=CAM_ASM_000201 /LENGTH=770 /DNA_ID=CAMNT_0001588209 /DNA_START=17 /DNA_END=2329 /DNA_ORIENTATION=-
MILHAVEDNIADVIDISDSDDDNGGDESSHREDSTCTSDVDEDVHNMSVMSTSGKMQIELELDDVKLKNEELQDKLKAQRDGFNRDKEKYLRQLQFLESENESAKKNLALRTEKYYDTKKKLQAFVRASDAEKKKLTAQITQLTSQATSSTSSTPSTISNQHPFGERNVEFDEKMAELEEKIMKKSIEAKELKIMNANLEEECGSLQQQLLVARSDAGNVEDLNELKQLQSQVKDLEFTLRHKNREFDKLEKSAKNSHILEENLSTCNAKVQSLQESIKTFRVMEAEYNTLVLEKKNWTSHFRDLLNQADFMDVVDDKRVTMQDSEVTPVTVLRLLSGIQSKCASLLNSNGILENKVSELTSSQQRASLQVQQAELDLTDKTNKVTQLENSNALLRQQSKLYEGEVLSLRSLLKTFDTEMLMFGNKKKRSRTSMETSTEQGKDEAPSEVSVVMKLKNQEIEILQREISQLREEGAEALKKLTSDVGKLSSTSTHPPTDSADSSELLAEVKREVKVYHEKYNSLKEEMYWFQKVAGFDFIPQQTKVLHLKSNPSLERYQIQGEGEQAQSITEGSGSGEQKAPSYFVTPIDELNHLKGLIKAGKLVPSSSTDSSESSKRPRSDSASNQSSTGGGLDSSSLNASRANVSMSAGGVDSQKMNQRLKEVFREKIAEYREAVYLLFGYKVDLMPADSITGESGSSMLKLRSMYAESPEDCLKFVQRKGHEGLEILETDFATGLDDSIILALKASNSVPTFLSEITLDLFGKQTFLG